MKFDYNAARDAIDRLAEGAERRENERNERDYEAEEATPEAEAAAKEAETRRDQEENADLRLAVKTFSGLAIDIAESLNQIAKGDTLSSGRRL